MLNVHDQCKSLNTFNRSANLDFGLFINAIEDLEIKERELIKKESLNYYNHYYEKNHENRLKAEQACA